MGTRFVQDHAQAKHEVTVMRFLTIAGAAALLLMPAAAHACGAAAHAAQATDLSAKETKKPMKKMAVKKKEKVEYMRAVPMK
jgi:hypothetical protein